MKLHVQKFTFNPFQENTYIVYSETKDAVIIDPGCYFREEENELLAFIQDNNLQVKALLNTHAHIDHIMGNQMVLNHFAVDFYLHKDDLITLSYGPNSAQMYGFPEFKESPQPTKELTDDQNLQFGDISFKVRHTPGHAPGHVVFYNEENNFVINGDVLFQGAFGRVDLPGGDMETLKKSIHDVMFNLPESTIVYCGHGPETTIGIEKISNYILSF